MQHVDRHAVLRAEPFDGPLEISVAALFGTTDASLAPLHLVCTVAPVGALVASQLVSNQPEGGHVEEPRSATAVPPPEFRTTNPNTRVETG